MSSRVRQPVESTNDEHRGVGVAGSQPRPSVASGPVVNGRFPVPVLQLTWYRVQFRGDQESNQGEIKSEPPCVIQHGESVSAKTTAEGAAVGESDGLTVGVVVCTNNGVAVGERDGLAVCKVVGVTQPHRIFRCASCSC